MFREALIKLIHENPILEKSLFELKERCKNKPRLEQLKIIKKWQRELKPVADKLEHQID